MRFLADESCDFIVVRALRSAGHDVLSVAEAARGAKDPVVLGLAREQNRVLLTEDKDFGRLIYAVMRAASFFRCRTNRNTRPPRCRCSR